MADSVLVLQGQWAQMTRHLSIEGGVTRQMPGPRGFGFARAVSSDLMRLVLARLPGAQMKHMGSHQPLD